MNSKRHLLPKIIGKQFSSVNYSRHNPILTSLNKYKFLFISVFGLCCIVYFQFIFKAQNNMQTEIVVNVGLESDKPLTKSNLTKHKQNNTDDTKPTKDITYKNNKQQIKSTPVQVEPRHSNPSSKKLATTKPNNQVEIFEPGQWANVTIAKGDSLSKIFSRLDLSTVDAVNMVKQKNINMLSSLKIGNKLAIHILPENQFSKLTYHFNRLKSVTISKTDNGEYLAKHTEIKPVQRIRDISAPIQGNLSNTASNFNIPFRIISKLSDIFRWDVDFARDIQQGDRFSIIYKENYLDGKIISTGDIIAAELMIKGFRLRAILHDNGNGNPEYYTPEGKSLRKAFMRSPLKHARITSKFSKGRFHPVLKRWRAHKGVDYGAARGTPIMATADGKIQSIGRSGAYGKAITLSHGKSYTTLYAHMHKFHRNLKRGERVKQGQIIGYVGSTGLATGPHLHYEFRISGKHKDPLTLELPPSLPLEANDMPLFLSQSEPWIQRLDEMSGMRVATLGPGPVPSG